MEQVVVELKLIFFGIRGAVIENWRILAGAGRQFWTFVWLFLASGLLLLSLVVSVPGCIYKKSLVTSKQNLHAVQLALERFAVDSPGANYPVRIEQIIEDGYMPQLPLNPFTMQPMRWGVYGSREEARTNPDTLSHGDFGYIPAAYSRRNLSNVDPASLDADEIDSYELILY